MYENDNREKNTVNWTTPSDNSSGYAAREEESRQNESRQEQGWNTASQNSGAANSYSGNASFQGQPAPDGGRYHKKSGWAKKAAGITAAAVLFGAVSGGVMTGVNYVGAAMTGLTNETAQAETQAQLQQAVPAVTTPGTDGQSTPVSTVNDVSSIVDAAMPSIVAINDTMTIEQRDFFGMPQTYTAQSSGSGIIVGQNDTELLIATNNHVVSGAEDLTVTFVDDKAVSAAVKGTDSATDLAIIAVQLSDIENDTMSKIKVATIGSSDDLKVGQQVIAIGNALGYGQSVTVGYVSALDREITDENGITRTFIQTDAAINPGNSGGALLDMNGNLIGINAAKTASTEVEGMGFAIPISKAQEILNNLMTKQTRVEVPVEEQGYLGIQCINIDSASSQQFGMPIGVYVYKIMEDGAAANSDLREKDIITKFDGQSVSNKEELVQMLTYYKSGTTVTLTVQSLTDGAYVEHEVEITLGSRPADEANQ